MARRRPRGTLRHLAYPHHSCISKTSPVTCPGEIMMLTQIRIMLAMSAMLVTARSVGSQSARKDTTSQAARKLQLDRQPAMLALGATSVVGATGGALIGGLGGLIVDGAYCERHHGNEPSFALGPCFAYVGDGTAFGWFGGSVVGAAWGAARVAERRGCGRERAVRRSALGAAVGLAPGILIVAPHSIQSPPLRSALLAAVPVFSGIGAAFAVRGCRGS